MTTSPTEDLTARIRALRDMGTKALHAEHERILGHPTKSFNTAWLRARLARVLAERVATASTKGTLAAR